MQRTTPDQVPARPVRRKLHPRRPHQRRQVRLTLQPLNLVVGDALHAFAFLPWNPVKQYPLESKIFFMDNIRAREYPR